MYNTFMQKDFPRWHQLKARIDTPDTQHLYYEEGQVWWMKIGHNVGSEQNGSVNTFSRPVVIVRGFSSTIFWGVPLSNTQNRSEYVEPVIVDGLERAANLSQLRVIDTRRVGTQIGSITTEELQAIKDKLKTFLS